MGVISCGRCGKTITETTDQADRTETCSICARKDRESGNLEKTFPQGETIKKVMP